LRVSPRPLGGAVSLTTEPKSAALSLGTVPLGRGKWHGRLPLGSYTVTARETGYFDATRAFVVPPSGTPLSLPITLGKDPNHPRWQHASPFHFELGALVGPWFAPTLNAGSEAGCPSRCANGPVAWGINAAASAGLFHDNGWGGELSVGYLGFEQSFSRIVAAPFEDAGAPATATYLLSQREVASGITVALRAVVRRPLPLGLRYFGALGGGLYVAHYQASVEGNAFTNDGLVPATPSSPGRVWAASPFVSTALGVERKVAFVELRAALGAWFFPTNGPTLGGPTLGVAPNCDDASVPGAVGCAPESHALAGERAHGHYWAFTPEVGATYRF
jgi:hypothetical protein